MRTLAKTKTKLILVAILLNWSESPVTSAFSPSVLPSNIISSSQKSSSKSNNGKWKRRRNLQQKTALSMKRRHCALHEDPSPSGEYNNKQSNAISSKNAMAHAAVTAAFTATLLTALLPLPANAGFGPTGGATTTQAPMKEIAENAAESLSKAKLQQLIDSNMRGAGLSSLADQINSLVDSLTLEEQRQEQVKKEIPKEDESKYLSILEYQAKERERLETAKNLQQQIIQRSSMLEKLEAQPAWFNYFAAFIGSVVSTTIMHPIDTIKTRLMIISADDDIDYDELVNWNSTTLENMTDLTANTFETYEAAEALARDEASERGYSTAAKTKSPSNSRQKSQQALQREGEKTERSQLEEWRDTVLNLYEGLIGNILKEGPPSALYLGVYEFAKLKLQYMLGITNPAASAAVGPLLFTYLAAGAAGETVGSTIRAPAESLKSLVQTGAEPSVGAAAKRVFATPEGRANTFKAWSASVCRDVPFGAIQLAVFELVKIYILNSSTIQWDAGTLQAEAIIGAFAGSIGALVTTPADVVTTRIITQDQNDNDGGFGVVGMAKKIYEEEGSQAFFSGWEQRVLYWAPAISIFLTCYCSVRQYAIVNDFFG